MADDELQIEVAERIEPICREYVAAWLRGEPPSLEAFLERAAPNDRDALRKELFGIDLVYRQRPQASTDSRSVLSTVSSGTRQAEPPAAATAPDPMPAAFGQYQVVSILGEGGFGIVYRGRDHDLNRDVAIKVPRPERVASPADVESFLSEARLLASFKHPGIVPVYCFGRTDDGLCYVVSQFVSGGDLAALVKQKRPTHREAAELLASTAEALAHAHQHGLVHRDIKPGNILIDEHGHPLVADFGLALTDDTYGEKSGLFGTPAYMSPEQACGDGHVVDARSDIYSLGVVFYELLTGRRPYRRQETLELLKEIYRGDTRPPRQLDSDIPLELERICLKAMARHPADRYTTAVDLAEDLRRWLRSAEPPVTAAGLGETPSGRARKLSVALGCGGLLTISITATAAALLAFVGLNQRNGSIREVADARANVQTRARFPAEVELKPGAAPAQPLAPEQNLAPFPSTAPKSVPDVPAPTADVAAIPPAPSPLPLEVRSIDIQHYARISATEAEPRGILGKQSFAPRLGDQITIEARLSRPAYAYLVAFRPDGVVEVCFPDDDTRPPLLTDRLRYPPADKADRRYGLSEGIGLWVFAVLASEGPLPAFRDYVEQHKPEWSPLKKSGAVWWFDGDTVKPLFAAERNVRGKDEEASDCSESVVRAAKSLRTDPDRERTAAIGFCVGP